MAENMPLRPARRFVQRFLRRLTAVAFCLCLVLAVAAGCSGEKKGSVYWLNAMPEYDSVLQTVAGMYTRETGVEVKIVAATAGTYESMLKDELKKSTPPTLFMLNDAVAVENFGGCALDLSGTEVAKELATDAFNLYDGAGRLVSLGCSFTCCGLIVNPTLLERAGYTLSDINSFIPLKRAAEDIHARAAELGFDAFTSNDVTGKSADRITGQVIDVDYWYEQMAARTRWTEPPAAITGAYIENFRQIFDLAINNSTVPPADLVSGGHDAREEFTSGKAVFYFGASDEYPAIAGSVPDAAMIPYYCGIGGEEKAGLSCDGRDRWAVNGQAGETDRRATLDFMYWCVTDPEASALLVGLWGVMPYINAAPSQNGFLRDAQAYAAAGCYVMNRCAGLQPQPEAYRGAIAGALGLYCADPGDGTWESVRTAIVDGWAVYAARG